MRQKVRELDDDGFGLTGHQPFEISAQRLQQCRLLDKMRQRDHGQDQHGHDGQQGVVRHRPGQQQALIGAEPFQRAHGEGPRVLADLSKLMTEKMHGVNDAPMG